MGGVGLFTKGWAHDPPYGPVAGSTEYTLSKNLEIKAAETRLVNIVVNSSAHLSVQETGAKIKITQSGQVEIKTTSDPVKILGKDE